MGTVKAYLFETGEDEAVVCRLCSHRCIIGEGLRGKCGVRENLKGVLFTRIYGRLVARNVDPIEKKPLFHLLPGSRSYSIAAVGCNFKCRFCQNADIAQMPADHNGMIAGQAATPEEVVADARRQACRSIAYTYTEPTVFFEFAHDTARRAHDQGIYNVLVTNGYMSADALAMIGPYIDGANVDLKAYTDEFYRQYCGARIAPVKATLRRMKARGILVEVTTLVIPGLNDTSGELEALAAFLAADIGPETPWHISRFHPTYKLTDRGATPVETLIKAREIGREAGLRYVYIGNVPGEDGEHTYCYGCGRKVISRWGFQIRSYEIEGGRCKHCGVKIDGVGM